MVKRYACLLCLALASCGPGILDGTFSGNPRYTVHGVITSLQDNPRGAASHITVLWQMTYPPPPQQSGGAEGADAPSSANNGTEPTSGVGAPNPNGSTIPTAPTNPTTQGGGSGSSVGGAEFPAPVSLTLLDTPQVNGITAPQGVGLVVVFYDLDGDGAYTSGVDSIAGTAMDTRLVFLQDPTTDPSVIVNCYFTGSTTPNVSFMVATQSCNDGIEYLQNAADSNVVVTAGQSPGCGTSP